MVTEDNEQFGLGEVPVDATASTASMYGMHLAQQVRLLKSDFPNVLMELNTLIDLGIITDYAIGGGYAGIIHGTPYPTYDLDVFVLLGSDEEIHNLYDYFEKQGNKKEGGYIYISHLAVQFFPFSQVDVGQLYHNAIKEAKAISVNGVAGRVVNVEYLIVLMLVVYREKDKIRVGELIRIADIQILNDIVRRFNNEQNQLSRRLKEVLGRT